MKFRRRYFLFVILALIVACSIAVLSFHEVDNSLTETDKQYIRKYVANVTPLPEKATYEQELDFVIAVQRAVLDIAPRNDGLPFDQEREPKDLFHAKTGLCFDRSRVIEEILRYSGFETRHIFICSTKETKSAIKSLLTPNVPSHAVTEVLTKRGWLVVDSNAPWVSTDKTKAPVSIKEIKSGTEGSVVIQWDRMPPSSIYEEPFTFIYGLYSRHGRFYPPYNFIPDINYAEFIQNIL